MLGQRCTGKANFTPPDLHLLHAPLPTVYKMRRNDARAENLAVNDSLGNRLLH